jgi:hypothetical protein
MRKYFLTILAIISCTLVFSQPIFKKNDIYFEFLGNGIYASLNYEHQFANQPGFGIRLGIGYYSDRDFDISIPAGINYLFKLKNERSFIDAGLGATWSRAGGMKSIFQEAASGSVGNAHLISFIPSIGYRRHIKGNFMWRISFTPVFNKYKQVPYGGISVGKRF